MPHLKALDLNQKIFEAIGLHPSDATFCIRFSFLSAGISLFLLELLGLISSLFTIFNFSANDFNKVLYGVFQSSCVVSAGYSWLALFFIQQKVKAVFVKFQQVYNRGNR